ncbi:MAG TPA: AAA family ATPase, partial [Candidatus Limnocylindrales bacterium]
MDRGGSATLSARAGNGPTPATAALLDARILGAFEVTVDGRRVAPEDWVRRSAQRLVKLLLVTRGHTLARETAAELLWPEAAPDASRVNLRKAIHFAHRALGGDGLLVSAPGRVGLDAAHISLDLDRVEAAFDLLSSRRSRRPEAAEDSRELARALEVVLEVGGFDLLPDDMYEDWLTGPREHLRYRWQQAALEAARTARDAGDPERALELLDRVLQTDAADEAAHRLVIEILAAQGRHHAVRRQFDLCRRALRATLDAAPSPETEAAFAAAQGQAPAHRGTVSPLPRLVARDAELRVVERLIARVADGDAAALAIHGPTGIGKSRLLRELAGFGRSAGWRVLEWQAVEATETPAYAPLHVVHAGVATADEALAWGEPARSGLASACPGLGIKPAIAFSERAALVDALVLALERIARAAPLVIAIDDLPWLDDATVELLQHVLARLPHTPILIAMTYRDDEPVPPAALLLLEQVRRAEGVELAVGPLGLGDVERLVTANLGGTSVHPDLARWAFGLSEGNPLFCLELVRAARERGTVSVLGDRWTMAGDPSETQAPAVSDTIRRLVARRMARLTGAPLELL